MAKIFLSLAVALAVPAFVFGILSFSPFFILYFVVIAGIHALLLAWPSFLILRKLKLANGYTAGLFGFLISAIPAGTTQFPRENLETRTTTYHSTFGQTIVDGIPTSAAWVQFGSVFSRLVV